MESFGELIWFVAYLVQMIGLLAGIGLVVFIGIAALVETVRRKVRESRLPASPVVFRGQAKHA